MSLKDPKNQKLLNDFISEHAPLIDKVTKSLRNAGHIPEGIDPDDLHLAALHGLMTAIHKYDGDIAANKSEEGDNPFLKFAEGSISGRMRTHMDQQHQVPKKIRADAKRSEARAKAEEQKNLAPQPETPSTPEPPKTEES